MGRGGEAMPSADLLRSDQRYAPFLSDSFDPSQFASNALANTQTTAQAQIDHLQQGIAVLDSQLRQLVLRHREDLIKHASKSDEVDVSIQRISLSVRSLQSVAARVRAEVMEPYQDIATKTRQLENIQTTVHLLRQTIHRVKLAQRLRSDFSPGNTTDVLELAKAARLLSDIASTDAEIDLSGIDIIDQDRDFLASTNASVRMRIDAALRSGLETLSQADVGSALQALYNLRELKVAVYTYLNSSISSLEKSFSTALDARKLSAASTSTSSSSSSVAPGIRGVPGAFQGSSAASRLQDVLWERLGEACDNLWRAAMSAWHLQRVLMKKRDPISHQLFIDTFMNDQPGEAMIKMPLDYFWDKTIDALTRSFSSATRGGFVRESLVQRYPTLASMLHTACTRISKDGFTRDAPCALLDPGAVLAVAVDAEEGYLSAVMSRLLATAKAAFPGGARAAPSAVDLQSFVAQIHEELKFVEVGGQRLVTLVARTVGNALTMAAERAAVMAASSGGADAIGVVPVDQIGCTPAQYRCITLCNALQELHRSVWALVPRMAHPPAAESLASPLEALHAAALDLMAPLFRGMVEAVQERILELHKLNLAADDGAEGAVTVTSSCVKDVCRMLAAFRSEYLSKFNPPPAVSSSTESAQRALAERMARRIVSFFVRHAALVRPLSRPGKLQLAKDGAELDAAVVQHIVPGEQVGAPLRTLRALRRLLFVEDEALEAEIPSMIMKDIQRSTVLHHLFSRLPAGIESPYTKNGLTPAQYSLWLDNHTEDETVSFIGTALKSGLAKAKSKGEDGLEGVVVELMERLVVPIMQK